MRTTVLFWVLLLMLSSCTSNKNTEPSASKITFTVDFESRKQQILAFGASDAWSCQFVGKNWPVQKRNEIASLLFGTTTDASGNPEGIGLSGWRFNIGAGSAEQGDDSQIADEWRRAECFLNPDGSYSWDKQAGQRWFLQAAKSYGVDCFTAFVNSPPVSLTKNGRAWSEGGSSANLKADNYDDFSKFLANIMQQLQTTDNTYFQFISPVNEPQWDWNERNQEGSPFMNREIALLSKEISKEFINCGISTKIEVPDAGHIVYLYTSHDRPGRENQAFEFFSPASPNYIGNLPNVATKVSGHSYFSTFPLNSMLLEQRRRFADALLGISPDLRYWQTEYCILDSNDEINGSGRDLGIDPALYMARMIHYDLVLANASSWFWWLAVSPYDYKDGLVYIDKNKYDGKIYQSKLLWGLGNYSRFVRPGMFRYSVARSDGKPDEVAAKSLMVSAYAKEDKSEVVFVIVNYAKYSTYPIELRTTNRVEPKSIEIYTTSGIEGDNLRLTTVEALNSVITISPRSIVTVVMDYK